MINLHQSVPSWLKGFLVGCLVGFPLMVQIVLMDSSSGKNTLLGQISTAIEMFISILSKPLWFLGVSSQFVTWLILCGLLGIIVQKVYISIKKSF